MSKLIIQELEAEITNTFFWHKYRPKNIDDVILLPRFKKIFKQDLQMNLILVGEPGLGKTTTISVYLDERGYDYLRINASKNNSIDDVRGKISDYCKTISLMNKDKKIVYLEEFDRASSAMQDGLRAFIEENLDRILWIGTCNTIERFEKALLSRFHIIDFTPKNGNEKKFLANAYLERIKKISNDLSLEIEDNKIKAWIKETFPDMRQLFDCLQIYSIDPEAEEEITSSNLKNDIINLILKECNSINNWNWAFNNLKTENDVLRAFDYCGSPLIKHLITVGTSAETVGNLNLIYAKYIPIYKDAADPWIALLALIYEMQLTIQHNK